MQITLVLTGLLVISISACAAPSPTQSIETLIPSDTPSPTFEPTQPPVEVEASPTNQDSPATATYTDNSAGFSLDYPAEWFIDDSVLANAEEAFAYTVGIATWDLRNPTTPEGKDLNTLPEGATKIDVTVVKQPMTLEEAVVQQSQNESGSPILAREDVTLEGGLPAVILDIDGFAGPTRTLITILNENVIYVSGYGNLEAFKTIALTLRQN